MKTQYRFLMVAFVLVSQTSLASDEAVFKPVNDLFLAMSNIDHDRMKAEVTEDFLLLEHGEVWTMGDLMAVVKPSDYKRTNYFSVININHQDNMAWINYWNKANFDNQKNSEDVVWLESVVMVKKSGDWKIAQMHSTRLEPKRVPNDIDFIKQSIDYR